jgi:threonine dehydrogenase-like Zn-dependent dehydrogenase
MLAARVYGNEDLRLENVEKPRITSPEDVIIKVKNGGNLWQR